MMPTSTVVLLILIGIVVPAQAQELHSWGEELKLVFGVLQDAHLSGSMELEGRCDPMHLPGFPRFGSVTTKAPSAVAALQEIAATDSVGMAVTQDADGTIRMVENRVQTDILNVRISYIVFQDYEHHDIHSANLAVRIILDSPEVVAFMQAHDIERPLGAIGVPGRGGYWPPESPYISGSLENVTVLEALDHVLAAFPGEVLVYWNCPKMQDKSEPRSTEADHRQQDESSLFSDCPPSLTRDSQSVPNPFCMPRSLLSEMPQFYRPIETHNQRRIVIAFFSLVKFGRKMLVVGG